MITATSTALELIREAVGGFENVERLVEVALLLPLCDWLPVDDTPRCRVDLVAYNVETRRLDVFDYKHGVQPVEAVQNAQLLFEACALWTPNDHDVWLHIVQPNGYDERPLKSWRATPADLEAFKTRARAAIEANAHWHFTESLDYLTYRPSAANCRRCPGFASCLAAWEEAQQGLDVGSLRRASPAVLPIWLRHADFVETWAKEVRELAQRAATEGAQIPGYKLVQPEGRRGWIRPAEAARELHAITNLPEGTWYHPAELLTPTQAEKALRQALKLQGVEGDALQKALLQLANLSERPRSNTLALVPESDKRAAVDPKQKFFGTTPINPAN